MDDQWRCLSGANHGASFISPGRSGGLAKSPGLRRVFLTAPGELLCEERSGPRTRDNQ